MSLAKPTKLNPGPGNYNSNLEMNSKGKYMISRYHSVNSLKMLDGNPHERETYIHLTDSPGVGSYIKTNPNDILPNEKQRMSKSLVLDESKDSLKKSTCTERKRNFSKYSLTVPLMLNSSSKII